MAPFTQDILLDDTASLEWHSSVCIGDGTIKDPTIADIDARRQAAGKMVAPTGAYADSDMFKLQCSRVSSPFQSLPSVCKLTMMNQVVQEASSKEMGQ